MDAKSIFIVVIILILLYYIVSTFLTSSGLTKLSGSDEQQSISSSKLKSGGSANSAYSIWIYVDDWTTNYGNDKIVFKRVNGDNNGLVVKLGKHTNDLIIEASHASSGTTSGGDDINLQDIEGAQTCDPVGGISPYTDNTSCQKEDGTTVNYYVHATQQKDGKPIPQPNGPAKDCNPLPDNYYMDQTCDHDTFSLLNPFKQAVVEGNTNNLDTHTCTVRNVAIQKWVNIIVSFNNNTLDIYMNGKLVKTCHMPSPAEISADADVIINPTGNTYSGQSSKFKFWNTPMDPQKAWYTYSDGFAPGLGLASFFNKYRFKMSILENNIETTSVTI